MLIVVHIVSNNDDLSIMKDEAKYNAALERAKERYSSCSDPALLERIFPELKENEGVRISKAIINYIKYGLHCGVSDADMIVWLEKQRDYIKLSNSTYTSNRDIIEFADKYSHTIWENLMDNFKKIENYSIGCNDVSDIVLNAIINTYNWLEKQKDVSSIERVFRPIAGCDIADAAMQAIEQQQLGYKIVLAFNGAYIRVEEKTADDIVNEYYSWLKKQSDNDSQVIFPTFTFDDVLALQCCMETVKKVREDKDLYEKLNDLHSRVYDAYHLEKQDEQKPYGQRKECFDCQSNYAGYCKGYCLMKRVEQKFIGKVEPKFHPGNWIIRNNDCSTNVPVQVIFVFKGYYFCELNGELVTLSPNDVHNNYHLWTIQDAKEGDVLVSGDVIFIFNKIHGVWVNCYCSLHKDGSFCEKNYDLMHIKYAETIYPSTKEQRNTLMKAMTDARYIFDFEKKEMKRIEQKVEPKFHPGGWIIRNNQHTGIPIQVIEFKGYYCCELNGEVFALSPNDVHNNFHLWTIQDAQDGDVLLEEETGEPFIYNGNRAIYFSDYFLGAHCGIYNGEFNPLGNNHHWGKNSCPATKEQRDLLFRKMKEDGYEWDFEKKEPKKIETKTLNTDNVVG